MAALPLEVRHSLCLLANFLFTHFNCHFQALKSLSLKFCNYSDNLPSLLYPPSLPPSPFKLLLKFAAAFRPLFQFSTFLLFLTLRLVRFSFEFNARTEESFVSSLLCATTPEHNTHPQTHTYTLNTAQQNETKQNTRNNKKKKQNKTQYNKTNKHNVECNCYAGYLYEVCAKGSSAIRGEGGKGGRCIGVFKK